MFIVDATRKITVNMANVISINQETKRIVAVSKVDDIVLGTYDTEERATEIYGKMLENIFPPNFIVAKNTDVDFDKLQKMKCNAIQLRADGEAEVKLYDCGVYYMPEE